MCDADGDAQLLFLEISELITSVEQDLKALDEGYRPKSLGFGAQLSTADAQQILLQLLAGWTQQVQRKAEREDLQADAEFAVGLESCFYFLNRGQAFNRSGFVTAPHNEKDREASSWEQNERPEFPTLSGHILNRSAGGIAVHCNQPRSNAPRVGQLLAIRSRHRSHNQAGVWFIASTRWLKVENADSFEMGAQYLAREAIPVAVRAFAEHVGNSEFHAALRIDTQQGDKTWQILITPCGFFASGRELELVRGGCREKIRCLQLFESGTGYERFRYEVVNTRNGSATTPGPG